MGHCIHQGNEDHQESVDYSTFHESEIWSLDISIARFILPRLKYLYGKIQRFDDDPVLNQQTYHEIKEGLEIIATEDACIMTPGSKEHKKVNKALDLLREHFLKLWW